ncbi:MAG: SAM-dependent methyltransferase [Bacilli bacterium]
MDEEMKEFEKYAKEKNIPIMMRDSIEYIMRRIKLFHLNNVLEIGTAIGYSAINFALSSSSVKVTTIEKDNTRFLDAIKNVNKFGLSSKIQLIFNDALEVRLPEKYNLIVIDAAKGKNQEFFDKFKYNLEDNGFIIIDNINFHGLVGKSEDIESKNVKKMVEKIESFIEYLKNQTDFYVEFVETGDGLAVCQKKIQ